MTAVNRISEPDAVRLAGVSARTLLRFSESGYLTVEVADDGTRLYSADQIAEIFGGQIVARAAPQEDNETCSSEAFERCGAESVSQESAGCGITTPTEETKESIDHETSLRGSQQNAAETAASDSEITRLRNLLSMQERMLDAKDDEIADLRSQRTWLRERIEKLEEKSDRDQILLLSETQTIRKLISYQESRKNVVQTFLEWIGIAQSKDLTTIPAPSEYSSNKAKTASGRTIEVPAAANDR
jgi:hypothetical protein